MAEARQPAAARAVRRSLLWAGAGLLFVALAVAVLLRPPATDSPAVDAEVPPRVRGPAVTTPTPRFTDITATAGIDFVHHNGASGESLLPEAMGGGVAFFDADGDQDMDLLLVDSGPWPATDPAGERAGDADESVGRLQLYRNDGQGRFENISADSGLAMAGYAMGVTVGDYDGDRLTDLFITGVGANALYRNLGGGRFEDVSAAAGVAGAANAWSTSAVFSDVDRDGDLDLYVTNYVQWSRQVDLEVNYRLAGIGRAQGPPVGYAGTHDYLYRNEGDGTFIDVSVAAGLHGEQAAKGGVDVAGKGLSVLALDVNADAWPDLLVGNDGEPNFLWLNRRDGRFEEAGEASGIAFDDTGTATGTIGTDAGWLDDNRLLAVAIGNRANEMSSLYVTDAVGASAAERATPPADGEDAIPVPVFTDQALTRGLGQASRRASAFGVLFFDYDLDGRVDLLQVNGHVEDDIASVQPEQQYAQAAQLYWNCGADCEATYMPVSPEQMGALARPIVGRGSAYADIDGDGDLDLILTQNGGAPMLLRNDTPRTGRHWLRIRLRDDRSANHVGIGARIALTLEDGPDQQRLLVRSRAYLSQVEPVASFGLGPANRVPQVSVTWPDGSTQTIRDLRVDREYEIARFPDDPVRLQLDRSLRDTSR
jgi:hypothetical protein